MNNKKTIIILILVLTIGIVGLTIAYFANSASVDNIFTTQPYGTTVTENFTSPTNWLPGDVTEKTIVATNTGEVDQAVRISYTEKWLDSNNNELNGWIHEDGTKSNHESNEDIANDERVAIINFDNNDDWTYNNGYYYYNYKLSPNESTSSLIKSVTFNPNTKLDDTCTSSISNGKKTVTCNSSGTDYDNATYTLTFTIETVQFNKYASAWNTDIAIAEEKQLFCDYFEVGELVTYNNQDYYVLKDSSIEDDYVTLLKKDPLTASEVNTYSTDYVSQNGEYPYYESDTCNENIQTGCSTNYDTSSVKKIIDGWSSIFGDDLVEIDGYKTRLIGENDIEFEYYEGISDSGYKLSDNTPDFIRLNSYWISLNIDDISNQIYKINYGLEIDKIYHKTYIRPIINVKKIAINGACYINNSNHYLTCNRGEIVKYNNNYFYVLKNSNSNKKNVDLIKVEALTAEEINSYSTDYVSQDGEYSYKFNYPFDVGYENSDIKLIIDKWAEMNVGLDVKTRLLDESYFENFENLTQDDIEFLKTIYSGKEYWAIKSSSPVSAVGMGVSTHLFKPSIYDKLYIRPTIYLRKNLIEEGCNLNNSEYKIYKYGDLIEYKNNDYCVIDYSNDNKDYVTVIKQAPLTYDELVTYNNGYEIGIDIVDNNVGTISYYKSSTCYYNSESDKNLTGCNNEYNSSYIKNIIDNWSYSIGNDLKEVNGYKTRLITNDELKTMGHEFYNNTSGHKSEKSDYDCIYIDSDYWTMSSSTDSLFERDIVSTTDENNGPRYIDKKFAIRPVINLKKCAIDNTCE